MTTTMEVSETLERVDNIVNMLDEICDHMDGFSSAEEAWLSSITETLGTWRYVMQETYGSPEDNKRTNSIGCGFCLRFRSWSFIFVKLGCRPPRGFCMWLALRRRQVEESRRSKNRKDQYGEVYRSRSGVSTSC